VATQEPETVPLQEYLAAVRECDQRFEAERDRRYAEVSLEREKALKIKEAGDHAALNLARENRMAEPPPVTTTTTPRPRVTGQDRRRRPSRRKQYPARARARAR
jgi:hypothetical protein